mgnify:CR=1 FL=1
MLDYKEIIIRHYGGGMSGRALAEQGFGSKSGINDFLSAFEACERLSFPLPQGITNYGIAEQTKQGVLPVGTLPLSTQITQRSISPWRTVRT